MDIRMDEFLINLYVDVLYLRVWSLRSGPVTYDLP